MATFTLSNVKLSPDIRGKFLLLLMPTLLLDRELLQVLGETLDDVRLLLDVGLHAALGRLLQLELGLHLLAADLELLHVCRRGGVLLAPPLVRHLLHPPADVRHLLLQLLGLQLQVLRQSEVNTALTILVSAYKQQMLN